jgi:electron transport complex protein RnfC
MQNSRDSSVWRSLAVAFGDGVAFGVGMKLTQSVARQPALVDTDEPPPAVDRFDEIERRMAKLEQAPAALPPGGAGAFDRKVMEAVIKALDARLNELSGQVERRLTETEAGIALELKALNRQDHALAAEAGSRMEEVRAKCDSQLATLRQSVDAEFAAIRGAREELEAAATRIAKEQAAAELDAYAARLEPALAERIAAAIEAVVGPRVAAAVASQLRVLEDRLREDIRQTAARASSLVASSAATVLEERMGPLRAELAARNAEIAVLRRRMAETDRNTLEILLAIGRVCQEASGKISDPAAPPPAGTAPTMALPEPRQAEAQAAPAEAPAAPPPIEPHAESNGNAGSQPQGLEALPLSSPAFGQLKSPDRRWRIPLVSSLVLTTAGLALMHLL